MCRRRRKRLWRPHFPAARSRRAERRLMVALRHMAQVTAAEAARRWAEAA